MFSISLRKCKKGVFFSTDAVIALTLIFLVLLVFYPIVSVRQPSSEIHYDVLKMLSSIDAPGGEKSALEYIGELYIDGDISEARSYIAGLLGGLNLGNENFGIWVVGGGGAETNIYSTENIDYADAERVEVAREMVFGLREGENATGYSALAALSGGARQDYFYFGGYVGDGNITKRVYYEEGTISYAEIEIAINNDFDLFVNGIPAGSYSKSVDEFTPVTYSISTADFHTGENWVEFKGDDLYIAGGFIKIVYGDGVKYEQADRYYFPGIEGIVNLYDGFYVPGDLQSMEVSLHLESERVSPFLSVGNVTVLERNTTGEETITISDGELRLAGLDYNGLSRKTFPIRMGLRNVSFEGETRDVDVFSVTDLSGSMKCSETGMFCYFSRYTCENICGGNWLEPINNAKEANEIFIDIILNYTGNRVGLVGYSNNAPNSNYHVLSNNDVSLKAEVNSWSADGSTCICCGVNRAVNALVSDSSSEKFRSLVVMSDGQANVRCGEQGTGSATQDAIKAACDAYSNYGIVVYTIGFGDDVDHVTLTAMAECTNGSYTYTSVEGLEEEYRRIADEIVTLYVEQEVEVTGAVDMKLFPDSYIEFDYAKDAIPYGLILVLEKGFDDASSGSFDVPADVQQVLEAQVTSYSGPRWTNTLKLNGGDVYRLSDYGSVYTLLGDPFMVQMPASSVLTGGNTVELTTGNLPGDYLEGSVSDKIIYKLLTGASAFSELSLRAEGCIWTIQFEDDSFLIVRIPSSYTGDDVCVYNESLQQVEDGEDAYQLAVLELLKALDLGDAEGKVDMRFNAQQLDVSVSNITGIPIPLEMEVQARVWY